MPSTLLAASVRPLAGIKTWAAYYGGEASAAADLARFDLIVLDPHRHPPLEKVKRHGSLVLMYLSLAEVNVAHPAFASVAAEEWVLGGNPAWPDARRLDVRSSQYRHWVLSRLLPAALAPGSHGLFLDTADSALSLEQDDPQRFAGMAAALESVIRAIRAAHPDLVLVLNGALPLADRLSRELDGVVVESVWTDYDFGEKRYRRRPSEETRQRMTGLRELGARGVTVLTLEYAPPEERDWIDRLLALSAAERFVPYVSTIGLDRVFTRTLH